MKHIGYYLLSLALICTSPSFAYDLPELGSHSRQLIPIKKEKMIGKKLYRKINSSIKVIDDPLLSDYIQTLGNRLMANAPIQPFPFHFFFIQHPAINAFTGPGGYVAVHSGLIGAVKNEAELASVLAHEISHATQHHLIRGYEHSKISRLVSLGAMALAIAIGSQIGGDATTGGLMAASALGAESQLKFSRAQEKEADRMGIQLLYNSGYDPHAMPAFLKTMDRLSGIDNSLLLQILSTHPLTDTRIADTANRVKFFKPKPYRQNNHAFNLIRARLIVATARRPQEAQRFFAAKLHEENSSDLAAVNYGYALASLKAEQFQLAREVMTELVEQHPGEVIYPMGLAEIYHTQQMDKKAANVLANQYEWYPDYEPLVQQYADTLIINDEPKKAMVVLNEYLEDHPANSVLLRLKARSMAGQNRLSAAYLFKAKADLEDGRYQSAKQMAVMGLRSKDSGLSVRRELQAVINKSTALIQVKLPI